MREIEFQDEGGATVLNLEGAAELLAEIAKDSQGWTVDELHAVTVKDGEVRYAIRLSKGFKRRVIRSYVPWQLMQRSANVPR